MRRNDMRRVNESDSQRTQPNKVNEELSHNWTKCRGGDSERVNGQFWNWDTFLNWYCYCCLFELSDQFKRLHFFSTKLLIESERCKTPIWQWNTQSRYWLSGLSTFFSKTNKKRTKHFPFTNFHVHFRPLSVIVIFFFCECVCDNNFVNCY